MNPNTFCNRLLQTLRRFRRSDGGNVVFLFALTMVPTIGLVGAAIDYSRANSAKSAMQSAIDSTALMLSKDVSSLSQSALNEKAASIFTALFHRPEVLNVLVTPTYSTSSGAQLVLTGSGTVATSFTRVLGQNSISINVSSTVRWGNSRLRVALVLDNTGSMADDGKMTALKTATKNLLTQLQSAAMQNGDVYVSIIPFAKDVNVGASNYTASWIDWTDWDNQNGSCSSWWYSTKSSCQGAGKTWTRDNHSTWNGCVTDRGNSNSPSSGNYDTNVIAPSTGNAATLFPAEQDSSCTQAIMPLNYNWSAMATLVNNMAPNGNTNQGIGIAHGWMSLVGGGPYPTPPAMDPNYQYSQVIILMSDGLNTENRWYTNASSVDAREAMACTNAKAAGITIYAIQVNTGGDPLQTVMKNCATTPDKFFMLTSASQLITTFQQIGTALSNLRVAK
jgi:Flp pilus assembly protein TadG